MMNSLTVFQFESQEVRIVEIDNEPWFVVKDVAAILGYTEPARMLQLVDDEDKQTINPQKLESTKMVETFGINTFRVSLINESGLYGCIFGSTKQQAKQFKKWVTSEVLPAIRKTGGYSVPSSSPAPSTQMELLAAIAQQMVEQERQIKQQGQILAQLVAEKEQAEEELASLPLSNEPAAGIPTRGRINMIVRNNAQRTKIAYQAIWSKLYLELYYRYKFDVKARCRNSGRKPLEQIEADGMLEALYAIASEVLI
ncbi:BRO family protein [Kamptonema sp. UHCC 0994]|uniref:BRO-N domain-containing protein n=1 Tax=Kamptonema sp. UHCC 0994 TaxID=3031329 RepID=UPI0023B95F7B|nr:BRO family protein [Kamptonema sp. UHCC 0994]MDF0553125.1 BRO family protein [Kamptonema sp. UHCC 0994]